MSQKLNKNAFTLAIGATALAGSMMASTATANPFEMNQLDSGYQQAGAQGLDGAKGSEGKCGGNKSADEGKCGGNKAAGEGKCGEGKCGMSMMDADKDGKVTKEEFMAAHEKIFAAKDKNGDGVLDAAELKAAQGNCGAGAKADTASKGKKEGKCGEGKCGANMMK